MGERILSDAEMDLVFRLSQSAPFSASAEERGVIFRMIGEGLLKIHPIEMTGEIEVTQVGVRSWFLTIKEGLSLLSN